MTTRARLHLLPVVIVTAALALVGAGCGSDDGGGKSGGSSEASKLLDRAFSKEVKSGELKMQVKADLDGAKLNGPVAVSLGGPFKSGGPGTIPQLDWNVNVRAAGQAFTGGVAVTSDNAFVKFQNQAYEVGSKGFSQLKQRMEQSKGASGKQTLRDFGVNPGDWLKNPEVKDGDSIGGDATKLVTGSVDIKKAIKDGVKIVQSPAVKRQLESSGQRVPDVSRLKDSDLQKVDDAVKKLDFEVNVDGNDVVRRMKAVADFELPKEAKAGSVKGGTVSFTFELPKVATNPSIEAPSGARPIQELLGNFGRLLGGGGLGSGSTGSGGSVPSVPSVPGVPGVPGSNGQ